jgi:hypothetical protein
MSKDPDSLKIVRQGRFMGCFLDAISKTAYYYASGMTGSKTSNDILA